MEIRTIYVVANATKDGAERALAVLKAWCGLKGIKVVPVEGRPPRNLEAEKGLVVALGGDGTVLRAAAAFADSALPILGANLGSLGFLTEVAAPSLSAALEAVLRGESTIEERARLSFASSTGKHGSVLNDLVVGRSASARFCELELLWSDGRVGTYPGDGLILSTATGSTAYNLSAGGPVIVPSAACVVATPLASHELGLRPVVFPSGEALRVRVRTRANLTADGDDVGDLPEGGEVTAELAARPTRLVHLRDAPPFFQVLAEKLNWANGRRPRAAP